VFEFTSERRMMSILVRDQASGKTYLFVKGADSAVVGLSAVQTPNENLDAKSISSQDIEPSNADVIKPIPRMFFRTKSQEALDEIEMVE
jgi:magnesium-transporting ATPase (P-type)